jgi:hypothetical protein
MLARMRKPRWLWAYERGLQQHGFFNQNLLSSFNAQKFEGQMRIDVSTFEFLFHSRAFTIETRHQHAVSNISLSEGGGLHLKIGHR